MTPSKRPKLQTRKTEITERRPTEQALRESEERLRLALDAANQGIFDLNVQTGEAVVTPEYARMLGYDPATFRETNAAWIERLHPDDREPVAAAYRDYIAGRTAEYRVEFRQRTRDGDWKWILSQGRLMARAADGQPLRMLGTHTDITERKDRERALLESETRYRQMFEANPHPMWLYDLETLRFVAVNDAAVAHYGYSRDEFLAMRITDIRPAADVPALLEVVARTRDGVLQDSGTWRHRLKDGRLIDVEITSHSLTYEGRHTKVVLAHDITARHRAEVALRESVERFELLSRAAFNAIWDLDLRAGTLRWNQTFEQLFGYPLSTLEPGIESWTSHLHREDRERVTAGFEAALRSDVQAWTDQYRFCRADGSYAAIEDRGLIERDSEGRAVRVVGAMQDVSARRQAEAALRLQGAALNAAANPIVITDRAGIITWANPAFTELSGYSVEEAVGRNPRDLVKSGIHPAEFYREMWATVLAGRVWRGEMTNRRKDGTLYPEELTITPVHNDGGEITHFIAIKRDLSNEKTLQSQLLQSRKMESVGRLAGGVAHDFNNLLTVINGTVDLALTALSPGDPLHADLREIQRAGERATALTRQLLAFSRQQVMRPQALSLNSLITDLLKMLGRLIGEDIELVTDLAEDLAPVLADASQLESVIVNLTVNARDAMPQGGTLTFVTRNVAVSEGVLPPGEYVSLSVQDTGAGMDEVTQARIFEPFYTTKESGKGTGLGLSTVYGIVTQSGGDVCVDSAPGRGTTFLVYLPRSAAAPVERRHTETPLPLSAVGSETVLIVDDEAALRSVAARILSRSGYRVLTAGNGAEAMQLVERHEGPIDLLLSDVVMPGMSGPQLAERLQQRNPGLKLLFTSGYTDDVALRHGLGGDRVQFIGKPYSVVDLSRKVREVLDGGRREDRA